MAEAVQPLTDAAKQFLAVCYRDQRHIQVSAIWTHYPELEERQEILGSRLSRFIRFPYMSCGKLKKVLTCTDFDHEECLNLFPSGRVYSQVFHLGGQAESTPSNTRATTLLLGARQWATGTFLVFHGLSSFMKTVNTSFINGVLHLRAELTIR
ncbi:hypothetical protein ACET3Z_005050 [Daucus carota]